MKAAHWAELLAAGAIGVVAGTIWQRRRAVALAASGGAPAPVPAALQNTAFPTSMDVTVAPGPPITQAVGVGDIVIVWLPLHGKWVSVDGAGITDPIAPQTFQFGGSISHSYVWIDTTSNVTYTTVVNFVVAPPPGVVTT